LTYVVGIPLLLTAHIKARIAANMIPVNAFNVASWVWYGLVVGSYAAAAGTRFLVLFYDIAVAAASIIGIVGGVVAGVRALRHLSEVDIIEEKSTVSIFPAVAPMDGGAVLLVSGVY
jgi:hypothetical protein